jgi:hypothetical protein
MSMDSHGGMILTGKTEELGEKHGLTRVSAVSHGTAYLGVICSHTGVKRSQRTMDTYLSVQ